MADEDGDYSGYVDEDEDYSEYVVTTTNPGYLLLWITIGVCILCYAGLFLLLRKKGSIEQALQRYMLTPTAQIINNIRPPSSSSRPSSGGGPLINVPTEVTANALNQNSKIGKDALKQTIRVNVNNKDRRKFQPKMLAKLGRGGRKRYQRVDFQRKAYTKVNVRTKTNEMTTQPKAKVTVKLPKKYRQQETPLQLEDFTPSYLLNGFQKNNSRAKGSPIEQKDMGKGLMDDESIETNSSNYTVYSLEQEKKEVMKLAIPWSLSNYAYYGSFLLNIVVLSHFLGVAEMICYTWVWYIIELFHFGSSALFNAIYLHVNNAIALDTDEGHFLAGKYLQLAVVGNILISIPASILVVMATSPIMSMVGYGPKVIVTCQKYAVIACLSNLWESTSNMLTIVLDIDGHAKYNAIFDFWDEIFGVVLTLAIVPIFTPSLATLGCIFFIQDIAMTFVFVYLTHTRNRWYDRYIEGFTSFFSYNMSDPAIGSIMKASFPLAFDEIIGELEWTVLAVYAAYMGQAEAATWVLCSYVWSIVEVFPENVANAAAYRVAHQLSRDNVTAGKEVVDYAFRTVAIISIISSIVLFLSRKFIVWCLSLDDTIEQMLLEVIPYIAICQALITVGIVATSLNEALSMYGKSVKAFLLSTMIITLPLGFIMTYILKYNIEGLAAAMCIGYTVDGLFNFDIFLNADWAQASDFNSELASGSDWQVV